MKIKVIILVLSGIAGIFPLKTIAQEVFPGADEKTPSRAQFFSWINNTNEGATEAQTLTNLDFFGMVAE